MTRSSKELKRIARDILNNRYRIPMGAFITAVLIPTVIELPFSSSLGSYPDTAQLVIAGLARCLILLIGEVLCAGVARIHLNLTRAKDYRLFQLFDPFRFGAERFFGAAALFFLFALLSCLPVVPGTVLLYTQDVTAATIGIAITGIVLTLVISVALLLNYQLVFYLLCDHSEMTVRNAFRESRLLMKGNKRRLFYILCSFIGWDMLIVCSFGIAALWVRPYRTQTLILFYMDCTGELDTIPVRDYGHDRSPHFDSFI